MEAKRKRVDRHSGVWNNEICEVGLFAAPEAVKGVYLGVSPAPNFIFREGKIWTRRLKSPERPA